MLILVILLPELTIALQHATGYQRTRNMKLSLDGGCLCGKLRYECTAEPILSYNCHCRDCQRTGGSGFLPILWVYEEALQLTGIQPRYFSVKAGSGRQLKRGFCPECGSTVLGKPEAPIIFIIASSLDNPEIYEPEFELWTSSKQSWDIVDLNPKHFEGQLTDEEMLELARF